jgi:hypothetical protein
MNYYLKYLKYKKKYLKFKNLQDGGSGLDSALIQPATRDLLDFTKTQVHTKHNEIPSALEPSSIIPVELPVELPVKSNSSSLPSSEDTTSNQISELVVPPPPTYCLILKLQICEDIKKTKEQKKYTWFKYRKYDTPICIPSDFNIDNFLNRKISILVTKNIPSALPYFNINSFEDDPNIGRLMISYKMIEIVKSESNESKDNIITPEFWNIKCDLYFYTTKTIHYDKIRDQILDINIKEHFTTGNIIIQTDCTKIKKTPPEFIVETALL